MTTKSRLDYTVYTKTGTKRQANGEVLSFRYFEAAWEVPAESLPAGKKRHRITGSSRVSKREAENALQKNIDKFLGLRQDTNPESTKERLNIKGHDNPLSGYTVQSFLEDWLENYKSLYLRPNTYKGYQGRFRNHIYKHIGDIPLEKLSYQHCKKLFLETLPNKTTTKVIDGELETVPLLQQSALANLNKDFSAALEHAKEKLGLATNPMKLIKPPPLKNVEDIDVIVEYSQQMKKLFSEQLDKDDDRYVRFALGYQGIRPGERCGLTWADISNLHGENPTMRIARQLTYVGERQPDKLTNTTKSGKPRRIPIYEPALSALRRHEKKVEKWKKNINRWKPEEEYKDLVLLDEDGQLVSLKDDNIIWGQMLEEFSIPHFRKAAMRHITAVVLAENPTIDIEKVREILGHHRNDMTRYYARQTQLGLSTTFQNFDALRG